MILRYVCSIYGILNEQKLLEIRKTSKWQDQLKQETPIQVLFFSILYAYFSLIFGSILSHFQIALLTDETHCYLYSPNLTC